MEMFIAARNYYGLIDLTLDVVHVDIQKAMLGCLVMSIFILPVGYQPLFRQALALALFVPPFFVSRRFIKNRKWLVIFGLAIWSDMLAGISGGLLNETIYRYFGFEICRHEKMND